jgi:serine/threonine protein kinase/WD40 repeat protein
MAAGVDDSADPLVRAVDKYLRVVASGEDVNRDAFISAFPDIADELRQCLEALDFVDGVAPQVRTQEQGSHSGDELRPLSTIGDYRIVREIGRGGMGVVYEAEQLSIGRKVALKVLPFAAVLDPKRLSRFKHEAQAAGALKHPHIVGVHTVGCERGVHYYAMELVEGKSLAQVIASQHEPAAPPKATPDASTSPIAGLSTKASSGSPEYFRTVTRLGIQAAEALDHAHQRGIVHRDVKPSNLMVDGTGHLWITDFGLAQIESDATRLTMSGDLLGTLRYMSPEQAAGDRRRLDHRTDIYSLGMTLYELLAGRPAFDGKDRGKLLRDIVECEPPAPRQLNAAIPPDLETIVLKAISKEPAARYDTAIALAADLQRFLDNKPILARRPSLVNRALRWCGRNRPVTVLSACLMLSLAASLFVLAQRGRVTSPAVKPPGSELGLRLVHRGDAEIAGNISPDGKRLAYPNWNTANVALYDLSTGGRRDITTAGTWEPPTAQYGEEAVWSHNGEWLAFNWYIDSETKGNSIAQLRISAADGTGERVAYQPKKRQDVWPVSWSGDGRHVFVQLSNRKDRLTSVLVDVSDGSARNLKSFEPPLPGHFQLSYDGRYVVYSRSPREEDTARDLFLLDIQSRDVSSLIDHPANDYAPFWTPDGRWIVFLSDRGGNTGLWAARFLNGRPLGEPRLVYARLADIVPKGFDKQGSYYYAAWQSLSNVYTAEVDFENNVVLAAPQKLASKYEGRNTSAAWSPDGTRLVYLSRLGPQRLQPRVTIRNLETGHETELQPGAPMSRLYRYSNLQWVVKGESLLMTAADQREQPAWFQIDLRAGKVVQLATQSIRVAPDCWSLSPDGRFLYLRRARQVTRVDIEKGTGQAIHQLGPKENDLRGLAVSPDGRQLAVATMAEEIRILSSDGKTARTLYRAGPDSPGGPASWALTWTPDGQRLVFGLQSESDSSSVSLWQLPVSGGEPQALGITMPELHAVRIHRDGRRILFIARSPGSSGELWAIDNVLAHLNALE